MSLPHEKLIAIQKALNGNDQIENMPCFIAADLVNEYEILKNRPGTPKIAIGWASSKARSNFPGGDITGRENQYLYATISRGRGLSQHRADNLIYGVGGGDSLVALPYGLVTNGYMACPNPTDGNYYFSPIWLIDSAASSLRGKYRGIYQSLHAMSNFVDGQIIQGGGQYAGKTFMVVKQGYNGGYWILETSNTLLTN